MWDYIIPCSGTTRTGGTQFWSAERNEHVTTNGNNVWCQFVAYITKKNQWRVF